MKNYYYLGDSGEVLGPVPFYLLYEHYQSGKIAAVTQICEEGTKKWTSFHETCVLANQKQLTEKKKGHATNRARQARLDHISKGGGNFMDQLKNLVGYDAEGLKDGLIFYAYALVFIFIMILYMDANKLKTAPTGECRNCESTSRTYEERVSPNPFNTVTRSRCKNCDAVR